MYILIVGLFIISKDEERKRGVTCWKTFLLLVYIEKKLKKITHFFIQTCSTPFGNGDDNVELGARVGIL